MLLAAVTLDGRMATRTGDSKWITGAAARTEGRLRELPVEHLLPGHGLPVHSRDVWVDRR